MRRKQKHILVGGSVGFGIAAIVDIISQWMKHDKEGKPFTWESYNGMQTLKNGALGFAAGAGVGYLIYEFKISEEAKLPFNSDEYLRKLLMSESLRSRPDDLKKVLHLREKVKVSLENRFRGRLAAAPEDAGSFYKRTAIASNFDLDIILPFRRQSVNSLEDMYEDVHSVAVDTFGHEAQVTKQSKAIELAFKEGDEPIYFDIVPGREINNYQKDKDLNLYVRPDWIWQRGSSFKTNVRAQQNLVKNRPQARAVVKLMKSYRDKNGHSLPGTIIEQCVTEALSRKNYGVHISITENLLNCMEYIASKISQSRFIDRSNTNNNLNEKVSTIERDALASQLLKDIERVEDNPRYLKEIFDA